MTLPIQLSRGEAAKHPGARRDALNEFFAFVQPADLSPVQRVAWLVYCYSTRVEMGGHYEYFSSAPAPDPDETVAALRAAGAMDQASILAGAYRAVTIAGGRAPGHYSNRYFAGVEYTDFEEFDEAFESCLRPISECLTAYLDAHESEFIAWTF
jgi:hypothetical protein